jgi:hypothetical protein
MNDTTRLAQLQRHWEFGTDIEIAHEIYHCETIYVTEGWEAPEWRAPFRANPSGVIAQS